MVRPVLHQQHMRHVQPDIHAHTRPVCSPQGPPSLAPVGHADARGLASSRLPNSPAIQGPRRGRARLQVHPQLTRDPKALVFPSMNHVPTEALSLVLDQWLKSAARAPRSGGNHT